ncbi:Cyp6a9 [Cordylochernes scorpioides]|uniref:Cyp6a9 n=1 Tax=Cordylochernes scorpioides TaxID=51811 RepID=A0ABY6LP50_9ARAC|nr:Cyp6a9 [Cordylochernes scorpioides]
MMIDAQDNFEKEMSRSKEENQQNGDGKNFQITHMPTQPSVTVPTWCCVCDRAVGRRDVRPVRVVLHRGLRHHGHHHQLRRAQPGAAPALPGEAAPRGDRGIHGQCTAPHCRPANLAVQGREISYDDLKSMPYLEAVISETLRLYPAVAANNLSFYFYRVSWFTLKLSSTSTGLGWRRIERLASEDYVLGNSGLVIPKGSSVFIPIAGLHTDPEFFPEPERFMPERSGLLRGYRRFLPENRGTIRPFTYLPFGLGPRQCVALRFAQMEAMVALAHLVKNFRFVRSPRTKVGPPSARRLAALLSKHIRFKGRSLFSKSFISRYQAIRVYTVAFPVEGC